jgi:methylmalonyl-CoA/ethylmalonyl-CoA epimerase
MRTAPDIVGSYAVQLGWVVKDFKKSEESFKRIYGIRKFFVAEGLQGNSIEARYFGRSVDFEMNIYVAYVGETQFEFIQPRGGENIYRDFLNETGSDGIQHVGHLMPMVRLDEAASQLTAAGYLQMQTLTFEISKVIYFDTRKEIGTVTEIVGFNDLGIQWDKALKCGDF